MKGDINASGNNFVTTPFSDVGYNTTDIQNLKLVGSYGYGTETFQIWEGLPTMVEDTAFMWVGEEWDENGIATKGQWYDYTPQPAVFSVPGGQAVTIYADPSIEIENAGQVPMDTVEFTLAEGNNFTGNPFPAALDIQNIKLVGSYGYGTETFQIWEGLPTMVEDTAFMWVGEEWDENGIATKGQWYDYTPQPADFVLDPYQGCVIFGSTGIKVEIMPPYDLSK